MYHILIVDEEEHLLWALQRNLFPDRQDIQVHTASTGEEGLERLASKPIDLLVCDIKMPGAIDGFQLILRAKEVAPEARIIIITAFGTHRIQNFAERIGISHYIEKPFNVSELREAILEVLDEKEGFQGVLSDLELTDIIQMLCLAKRTALLHLKHRDHRGRIVFERGEVVHADFDAISGPEAVYRMLVLRQGDIFMQSDFHEDRRTIDMGWQDLLLEGVRRADEHRMEAASEAESTSMIEPPGGKLQKQKHRSLTPLGVGVAAMLDDWSDPWDEQGQANSRKNAFRDSVSKDTQKMFVAEATDVSENLEEARGEAAGSAKLEESSEDFLLFSEAELAEIESSSKAQSVVESLPEQSVTDTAGGGRPAAYETGDSEEIEAFAAPTLGGRRSAHSDVMPAAEIPPVANALPAAGGGNDFRMALERFSRDCPGLHLTGFIAPEDGIGLDFVDPGKKKQLDELATAAYFSEIVTRAHQTVRALNASDSLQELQIALDNEYILLRAVENTPYFHLAVIEKNTSLGIALVLMRQLGRHLETVLA